MVVTRGPINLKGVSMRKRICPDALSTTSELKGSRAVQLIFIVVRRQWEVLRKSNHFKELM